MEIHDTLMTRVQHLPDVLDEQRRARSALGVDESQEEPGEREPMQEAANARAVAIVPIVRLTPYDRSRH